MKVFLDFTQIPLERTGVGVYADHLAEELPRLLGPRDELLVLVQDDDQTLVRRLSGAPRVTLLQVPSRFLRNRAALLLFEQLLLPWLLMHHRVDLAHSLHYTFPLVAPCARAVTVHDLTFTLFPALHTRGRRLLFPFFTRRVLARAECPIYVSSSTQADAERLFGPSRHPGFVTPLGVEPAAAISAEQADAWLLPLGVQPPYFLFLGTLEPRKNIVRLVQAFERVASHLPGHRLVLAGKPGWHTQEIVQAIEGSACRERIQRLGFVTEQQKQALLARCEAVMYVSLYEGFGLPVLEAMAAGAPTVCGNTSSLPEVAGDAALLVDPFAVEAVASAMRRVAEEPELRLRLAAAGRARAACFHWRATAEATVAAYRACAREGG